MGLALPADKREAGFGFAPKSISGSNSDYPLDDPVTVLNGELLRQDGTLKPVTLVPIGAKNAQLRRLTFPIAKSS